MTERERSASKIDLTTPSVARIYDYLLGGKDHFPVDRAAAEQLVRLNEELGADVREVARANRAFLVRAVETAARAGVRQFLDIGTGLPTQDNVHQVAQRVVPDARIVYCDNDPIVLVHARALLADNPGTVIVEGDARDPKAILEAAAAHLDFSRPVAVLLVAVLHFLADDEEVAGIVRTLREPLVLGSHLIVSHTYMEIERSPEKLAESYDIYRRTTSGSMTLRDRAAVRGYFDGLELLEPGVVPVQDWRNDEPFVPPGLELGGLLGAVGRVP
ncbi:SAM-dependent methyltransferase [Nonomuraea rhizosphaerae]|uniref:SAM-dependent methyltransferase n=1 Tax=Nonomuraea rhizosphaerae TaxID=2665663 RepID=UPI001C5D2EC0|nr:SAM-dependent methyltransferase [Nonomuraea rhizosphaerae]